MPPKSNAAKEAAKAQRELEAILSGPARPPGSRDPRPDWRRAQIRRAAQGLIASGEWAGLSPTQKRLYEKGGQFSAAKEGLEAQRDFQRRMKGK